MPRKKREQDADDSQAEGGSTELIRVFPDIKYMAKWVCKATGTTNAVLVDPVLRPFLATAYEKHRPLIEQMQAAEEAAKKARRKSG